MSLYDTSPEPPQTYEVIDDLVSTLEADSGLSTALGTNGQVFGQRKFLEYTNDPDRALPGRLIVVREPVQPGGRPEGESRYDHMPVQIMAHVSELDENVADIDKWLSEVHTAIHQVIVGTSPSVTQGAIELPIERRIKPSGAAYDAETQHWYSSAEYRLVLKPA